MSKCGVCGWEGETPEHMAREMMYHTREEFPYFICPKCNCMQLVSIPEDLGKYYRPDYYSYQMPEKMEETTGTEDNTRVLDVGCGAGAWLCGLRTLGLTNLDGCDPFIEKDIVYQNGVKIYKRTIHEMEGPYDWIYFNDSFEHVADPNEVMESIRRLLSPAGIARLELPVFPNIAYELFDMNWYQIDAPRHIFLHSKSSIGYLAENHGLKIVKKEYDSNINQIIRSFLYSRDISYYEQDQDIVDRFFTSEAIEKLEETVAVVNQNEYGDHAVFYLMHQDSE